MVSPWWSALLSIVFASHLIRHFIFCFRFIARIQILISLYHGKNDDNILRQAGKLSSPYCHFGLHYWFELLRSRLDHGPIGWVVDKWSFFKANSLKSVLSFVTAPVHRWCSTLCSGFMIQGKRLLTNAHCVEHHTQVSADRPSIRVNLYFIQMVMFCGLYVTLISRD